MYQELSIKDREFINAMAASPDEQVKMSTIVDIMQKPKNYLSNYRRRLLDDQLIETKALPFFADFIKEYEALY